MRIIGGTHRSRRIGAPKNMPLRPTTDFAKESLFNIIENNLDIETLSVLDLFSGTGSISYEFASRGCEKIIAVEANPAACDFIKKQAAEFGFKQIRVVKNDVFRLITHSTETFDLIFADPPFELKELDSIHQLIFEHNMLKPDGWLIVEHSERTALTKHPCFVEKRSYGAVHFSIFKNKLTV